MNPGIEILVVDDDPGLQGFTRSVRNAAMYLTEGDVTGAYTLRLILPSSRK